MARVEMSRESGAISLSPGKVIWTSCGVAPQWRCQGRITNQYAATVMTTKTKAASTPVISLFIHHLIGWICLSLTRLPCVGPSCIGGIASLGIIKKDRVWHGLLYDFFCS